MIITDVLNGHTVEDVRRNTDGSVSLYCASGRQVTLFVCNGRVEAKPAKIILPDSPPVDIPLPNRMRLLTAFQGFTIEYCYYDDANALVFVCEPLRHDREAYTKASGHREIRLAHTNGLIDELPPVSAKVALPALSLGTQQGR
jgi:hypothetical protein